jgi:microcystin-dependent protein
MSMSRRVLCLLVVFSFISNIITKSAEDCGTPVECFMKAKSMLDQDRKEMRNAIDKLTSLVEEYKKNITESTKNEINSVTTPIGTIVFYSFAKEQIDQSKDLPSGWASCDGKALLRSEYPQLFSIIGINYGAGDGTNSFNLPDLRGRTIITSGQGNGLSYYKPGLMGGEESHTLSVDEMPAHQHQQGGEALHNSYGGGSQIGYRTYPGGDQPDFVSQFTSVTGGSRPHNNLPPYISHHAIIRIK